VGAHLFIDGYNLALSGVLPLAEDPRSEAGRQELCGLSRGTPPGKGSA